MFSVCCSCSLSVRRDLLPAPPVILIILVTLPHQQLAGLRVDSQAPLQHRVEHLLLVLLVLPRSISPSHVTVGDGDCTLLVCLNAPFSTSQLSLSVQPEHLRSSIPVASTCSSFLWRVPAISIQALTTPSILQLSPVLVRRQAWVLVKHIIGNLFHEPVKTLAVLVFLELQLLRYVPHVNQSGKRFPGVEVLLVLLIKPSLYNSLIIPEGCRNSCKLVAQTA